MLVWTGSIDRKVKSYLFLDRDGVINHDRVDYVKSRAEMVFYPDALEALRWLHERAVATVLVSNQSGLGRGIIRWTEFWDMHERMVAAIRSAGGDLLAAFYCPHRPEEGCSCRKPAPGMILAAAKLFSIPLGGSFLVGDRMSDIQAMVGAGGQGVLLAREEGESSARGGASGVAAAPTHTNLMDAVRSLPWSKMG